MKLLLCLIMMFSGISPTLAAEYAYVLTTTCAIYETADFSTPLSNEDGNITLSHNDMVTILEESGDFIKVAFQKSDSNLEGYVYRYYLSFNNPKAEEYPVFNGSVQKEGAVIYQLDKTESEHVAKKGQGIYLYNGFDSHAEFNAVEIVLDDGSVYYGLMKTMDISPNGINAGLITGIMVIISCLTIIFLLLFIQKKKKSGSKG